MKIATLLISLVIFIIVLVPGPSVPDVNIVGFDKIVHIGLFATWALAVRYDFDSPSFKGWIVFIVGILFCIATEAIQLAVKGRSFDLQDIIADIIGLALGLLISGRVVKLLNKWFKA